MSAQNKTGADKYGFFHSLKGYIRKEWAKCASLWGSSLCRCEDPIFHYSRLKPAFDGVLHGSVGVQFFQEELVD
jgi:hypothetical protein